MFTRSHTIYASTDRTAAPTAAIINTGQAIGVHVGIHITSNASTVSVTPTFSIEGISTSSFYTVLTGSAATTAGYKIYKYGLDLESTNNIQRDYLPEDLRLSLAHSSTASVAYSVICKKFYPSNEG